MPNGYDALVLYHDAEDPRLIVPKRNPAMGWTLNVDHRYGRVGLAAVFLVILAVAALPIAALLLNWR